MEADHYILCVAALFSEQQFGYRYTGDRLQAGKDAAFRVLPVACGLWPLSGFAGLGFGLWLARTCGAYTPISLNSLATHGGVSRL